MNNDQLINAIAGDSDAFAELLEENYDFIFAVAWKWCGNKVEAEDIAQDVCLKLSRAIKGFQAKSSLRTWLYQVTLNQVRDYKRKQQNERRKTEEFLHETEIMSDNGNNKDDEVSDKLWSIVRTLPDNLCDAVLLVYGEGLNHAQAAKILKCAETTISWRLMEARKQLKNCMQKEMSDE